MLKKTKKYMGRFAKWIISGLPAKVKNPLIRNLIKVERVQQTGLIVKIAETKDDYEQVFKLLRKNYVDQGFIKAEDPLSINKYQVANTSVVLIAKLDEKVIGTLTLVKKDELGLPLERVFSTAYSLAANESAAEITCLAVDNNYRRKNGFNCLFPLMKFMYIYANEFMKVDKLFIACFPRDIDFYSAILFFKKIQGTHYVPDYLGAPATCLMLDMKMAPQLFQKAYDHKVLPKNLYSYFVNEGHEFLFFPKQKELHAYSCFSYEYYQYFLNKGYTLSLSSVSEYEFYQNQFGNKLKMAA